MVSRHRYPLPALRRDYLRAGFGLSVSAGPLLYASPSSVMVYLLGGMAALFAVHGLRTLVRQASRIEIDEEGISVHGPIGRESPGGAIAARLLGWGTRIQWRELRKISLRYFSTRRDRSEGWMQLTLRGERRRLHVDSTLSDFPTLAAAAGRAAVSNHLPLNAASRENFMVLGVSLDPSPGGE